MAKTLDGVLKAIKPLDSQAMASAKSRQDNLTKPPGSLGRLEELSVQLAGIQGKPLPQVRYKAIITMAADHGVVAEKIGNWPQEVTTQMVYNFLRGGAAINVLARQVGARVIVVDMGVATDIGPNPQLLSRKVGPGTGNMAVGPAMTREHAIKAIETGIELVTAEAAEGLDIVGTGDMGIGNTTSSSAICAAITGQPASKVTGRGTGIDDRQLARKIKAIEKALRINQPNPEDPLDVLSKVGGFEIGGLAGVILAGAAHRIPLVIDGFIAGAAALIAAGLSPRVKDYLIPAHLSVEAGHKVILDYLGVKPLLDLGMRLGEGTGAALGIFLAEAAARSLTEMATFAEAEVSEAEPPQTK